MGPRVTAEVKSTETTGTPASGATGATPPRHGPPSRCNAPQREPVAPLTAWGRPRGVAGWSLRELARRTGINPGELSKIERGLACPTPDQAWRILEAYLEVEGIVSSR